MVMMMYCSEAFHQVLEIYFLFSPIPMSVFSVCYNVDRPPVIRIFGVHYTPSPDTTLEYLIADDLQVYSYQAILPHKY